MLFIAGVLNALGIENKNVSTKFLVAFLRYLN